MTELGVDGAPISPSSVDTESVSGVEIADPADDQAGIEALDGNDVTIVLRPGDYAIDSPPLQLTGDRLSLVGWRSSRLFVPDGTIADNNGPKEVEITGSDGLLSGFTFDGNESNQGADDTYGIRFGTGATNWTVSDIRNLNAVGDGFGDVRAGTTITNCQIRGFSEGGIHFKDSSGALVSNCNVDGQVALQVNDADGQITGALSGLRVSNCRLVSTAGNAVNLGVPSDGVDTVRFVNCEITGANHGLDIFGTGAIDNLSARGCDLTGSGGRAFGVSSDVNSVTNSGIYGGKLDGANAGVVLKNATGFVIKDAEIPSSNLSIRSSCTSTRLRGIDPGDVGDSGTATAFNGAGSESANAETPTVANWRVGDRVDFTDSGDGSGTGVYLLDPSKSWVQIN